MVVPRADFNAPDPKHKYIRSYNQILICIHLKMMIQDKSLLLVMLLRTNIS